VALVPACYRVAVHYAEENAKAWEATALEALYYRRDAVLYASPAIISAVQFTDLFCGYLLGRRFARLRRYLCQGMLHRRAGGPWRKTASAMGHRENHGRQCISAAPAPSTANVRAHHVLSSYAILRVANLVFCAIGHFAAPRLIALNGRWRRADMVTCNPLAADGTHTTQTACVAPEM